jgi:hypothetical protein
MTDPACLKRPIGWRRLSRNFSSAHSFTMAGLVPAMVIKIQTFPTALVRLRVAPLRFLRA